MRSRNSGPRSGAGSQSKLTNQSSFDPQQEEISCVAEKYYTDYAKVKKPIIRQLPMHPDFLMPVSIRDVENLLGTLPKRFTHALKAVFLLGGSKKQAISWSKFAYGTYSEDVVYLHPFPKAQMKRVYKNPFQPHLLEEYRRAGARLIQKPHQFIIEFDRHSLKQLYLWDVLIHEIGHHVDRTNFGKKRLSREESFAEWFATEYGFRLRDIES